jgi:pimeloyl-ACP methyl ester carboxylesterase
MTGSGGQGTAEFAPVNGLRMYFETSGAGPPLVLIHGSLMTIGLMNDFPARLSEFRQVIAVELQAHGHTADIDRPLRYELLADDIAALLDHLDLADADVFGYSLGAGVALQAAIRHPARVRKLIAASVTYRSSGLHAEMTAQSDAAEAVAQLEDSPYHDAYRATAPNPDDWPTLLGRVFELDAQPQDWAADDVAGIAAPTMLIAADNDIVRLEHAVEMIHLLGGGIAGDLHGLPASQLLIVPGTTHTGLTTRAAWLAPMIRAFLEDGAGT